MQRICRNLSVIILLALPCIAGAEVTGSAPASAEKSIIQPVAPPATAEQVPSGQTKADKVIKFGYVDMLKIGSESDQGKAAKAKFEAKADRYKGQFAAKQKQLEKQKKAIQAKLQTMSPEQRAAKAKEFDKKVEEFQKYVQKAEKEMQDMQEEVSRKLFSDIEQVVEAYGKANGFTAICVKKDVLYLASGVDVQDTTDDILKLVNEKTRKP